MKIEMGGVIFIGMLAAELFIGLLIIISNLPDNLGSYLNITIGNYNLFIDW
jgi:hypothetical protein